MKTLTAVVLFTASALTAQQPVNPQASPEARALLRYLYSISGKAILSGQHNYPLTIANWTNRSYEFTGKYPAVFGQDFGFQGGADKDSVLARPALVAEAKRQYRNGAIVTLTWHAVRPTDDEPVSFRESVQGKLTDFEWQELTTPGTALQRRWCAQVDVIASYLRQLRDARVPVLWRPYHEVNGAWFWWGGRKGPDGSAALYRQLYDRFVNVHHLDNLIWVWNANAPGGAGPYADYFPGIQFADVLSVDNYGEYRQSHYTGILALAAGKPVALGEVGAVPAPAVIAQQPLWTWFMTWSEFVETGNSEEALRALYNAPATMARDDPRVAGPLAAIRSASAPPDPEPVTPDAAASARELLRKLVRGKAQAVRDVDVPAKLTPADGLVAIAWRPARPTGGDASTRLSNFEWKELLTPGTRLNQLWIAQVDAVAAQLKQFQDAGIAVLWRPYPHSNGTKFWWAGRKEDSPALYRALFDRLTTVHKLRNLVWVWSAVGQDFDPEAKNLYSDFFPGLAYVDTLSLEASQRIRRDAELARFAVGKPVGIESPPGSDQNVWSWFLTAGASK